MAEAVGTVFGWGSRMLSIPITVFEYTFTLWELIIVCFLLYIGARLLYGILGGGD